LQLGGEFVAADQSGSIQADVEIGENISRLQAARPRLAAVEMAGRIVAPDHRADRGADHHIGNDAVRDQGFDDADMGKSARRAPAQRKAEHRPPDAAEPDLVAPVLAVWVTGNQVFQHLKASPSVMRQASRCRRFSPSSAAGMVYGRSGCTITLTGPQGPATQA